MNRIAKRKWCGFSLLLLVFLISCTQNGIVFKSVAGFTDEANAQLYAFFQSARDDSGRKIAVFDGDGTVLGQAPHYLADECMYQYAKSHPNHRPGLIKKMKGQSNVSLPYVQNRVHFIAGMTLKGYRDLGDQCFQQYYSNKIFPPIYDLISLLKKNNFEIWIVTASPEGMYQQFLSKALDIPITHIIGVKSVIRNGIITDEIVIPVPQDHGKKEAIETFVQDTPLLVAGNSRGDKEMIEFSRGLKMIVNPDEHIAVDQTESIADYAKRNNWLIVHVNDVPAPGFPGVSSKDYGIRLNKTNELKVEN
ncbi:haloacid dehalogenase-like hydrolase [candidate division KSB1 bacterium]|nr:haloacid dehalogenase-like hydrolase [candidate division KSB1 bacterium]